MGSWDEAITALEKAMGGYLRNEAVDPHLPASRAEIVEELFLALAYYQKGNHSKAREWYDRSVRKSGKLRRDPDSWWNYELIDLSSLRAEAKRLIDVTD
jgi:tetratricopeptide (TPR) repeat protein